MRRLIEALTVGTLLALTLLLFAVVALIRPGMASDILHDAIK